MKTPRRYRHNPRLFWLEGKKNVRIASSSLHVWRWIVSTGYLSRTYLRSYNGVRNIGPCTSGELHYYLVSIGEIDRKAPNGKADASRPLANLTRWGCLERSEVKRPCTVAKHNIPGYVWNATSRHPSKGPKIPPLRELLPQCLSSMQKGYLMLVANQLSLGSTLEQACKEHEALGLAIRQIRQIGKD